MAADLIPHEGDLEPDEDYEVMLFDGASFTDAEAEHCHFLDSSFLKVAFDGGRLRQRGADPAPAGGRVAAGRGAGRRHPGP